MRAPWRLPAPLLAGVVLAALVGCPTREFYRIPAEPPWEQLGPEGVAVPAFGAAPDSWSLAERARGSIVRALERGAVPVAGGEKAAFHLVGRITEASLTTLASAPRRILRAGTNAATAGPNVEAWVWEQEIEHVAVVKVALRLERVASGVLWQRSGEGRATRSSVEALAWPGSDPLPPPPTRLPPVEPGLASALREQALTQALAPLIEALTDRYDYRVAP